MSPEDLTHDFYCPLCRSNHFRFVVVKSTKTEQTIRVDGLFHCAGCTTVFTDPAAFMHLVQDRIVSGPHYRERKPTREYPPDAETVRERKSTTGSRLAAVTGCGRCSG